MAGVSATVTGSPSSAIAREATQPGSADSTPAIGNQVLPNSAPVAVNDSKLANPPSSVTLNVTANGNDANGNLDVATIDLDPSTPQRDTTYTVPGQGTWSVDNTGKVTFAPAAGFKLDPTPNPYTGSDQTGLISNAATITIDYVPVAASDTSSGNVIGTTVTVNVLANDTGGDTVDPTTVQLVGTAGPGQPLVVVGQGTWSVNPTTGAVTFTPQAGFTGTPTPIQYTFKDREGNRSAPASISVQYERDLTSTVQSRVRGVTYNRATRLSRGSLRLTNTEDQEAGVDPATQDSRRCCKT